MPPPLDDESFCEYVTRLGLDCADLLEGLDAQTKEIANLRLATKIQRIVPDQFHAYVTERAARWK